MIDFAAARYNMVESQVRTNDVTDLRIHKAMAEIPRERFVPKSRQSLAYMDANVPVGEGRVLLEPRCFAKMAQAASIRDGDVVLDIGCATGYSTAVLAALAEAVVALECDAALAEQAGNLLTDMGIDNAAVITGALPAGCPDQGPYDVIFLNGAVEGEVPDALLDQLRDGGRLVAVCLEEGAGHACLYTRAVHAGVPVVGKRAVFDAIVPVLPGFEKEKTFVFEV